MQTAESEVLAAPQQRRTPVRAAGSAAGRETAVTAKPRILVVEDEAVVAMEIAGLLEEAGYQVVGAVGTAAEAVAQSRRLAPDLVLLDIRLRGERDGIAAAEQLVSEQGARCIFVSAATDAETVSRARALGAGLVRKPYDPDELLRAIATALR